MGAKRAGLSTGVGWTEGRKAQTANENPNALAPRRSGGENAELVSFVSLQIKSYSL